MDRDESIYLRLSTVQCPAGRADQVNCKGRVLPLEPVNSSSFKHVLNQLTGFKRPRSLRTRLLSSMFLSLICSYVDMLVVVNN